MEINKIQFSAFRNFSDKGFSFSPKTSVIVGPNGVGKTNILEGIFLLSTGKSFRAKVEEEMVSYSEEIARVKGKIIQNPEEEKLDLEVMLTRGEIGMGTPTMEKIARKRVFLNGVAKRVVDFAGELKTVLFGPWDLDLITESPSVRRRFLDTVLSQVDREYRRSLLSYEKGLRQRNKLLINIREEGRPRSQLLFWNQLLIKNGDYISNARENFIDYINQTVSLDSHSYKIDYDKSSISEARLEQYSNEEVAAGTTLVGPHRDDFLISSQELVEGQQKEKDLARYGSRGEQRMAVLWLKLAELSFIEKKTNFKPVLLLDDIFSELDHEHRKVVADITQKQQTIITTADPHYVDDFKNVETIELK